MKGLVYGFKPRGDKERNISQLVLEQIAIRGIQKCTFEVVFDKKHYQKVITGTRYDYILGLGEANPGTSLRRETAAYNEFTNEAGEERKVGRGPNVLETTRELPETIDIAVSSNPGRHASNYSMRAMLHHMRANEMTIPFGFVHVPAYNNMDEVLELIEDLTNSLSGK